MTETVHWNTHIVRPNPGDVAIIAVHCPIDNAPFLLGELYVWNEAHHCFIGEVCGLKLKHDTYWWTLESAIMETLPT